MEYFNASLFKWTSSKRQLHLFTCKNILFWEMYPAERVKAKLSCNYVTDMVSVCLYHPVKQGLNISMSAVRNTKYYPKVNTGSITKLHRKLHLQNPYTQLCIYGWNRLNSKQTGCSMHKAFMLAGILHSALPAFFRTDLRKSNMLHSYTAQVLFCKKRAK